MTPSLKRVRLTRNLVCSIVGIGIVLPSGDYGGNGGFASIDVTKEL